MVFYKAQMAAGNQNQEMQNAYYQSVGLFG